MDPDQKDAVSVMVASTVYHFEDQLDQICGVLKAYGYHVINSHIGTVPPIPHKGNLESCLAAVDACDVFLGIIRPFYGSGIVGRRSITHCEMLRAIEVGKPCWWLVHEHVTIARQLLRQNRFHGDGRKKKRPMFRRNAIMDDLRVLDLYDDVIRDGVPIGERVGNWAQPFSRVSDVLTYLKTVFAEVGKVREVCGLQ